jgi:hypothetical protein
MPCAIAVAAAFPGRWILPMPLLARAREQEKKNRTYWYGGGGGGGGLHRAREIVNAMVTSGLPSVRML